MTRKFKLIIGFGIVCLCMSLSFARDRERVVYHLERGSRLWINGNATLGSYECKTVAVFGVGSLNSDSTANGPVYIKNSPKEGAKIAVQVRLFDCGNPAMNEDMYDALKADNDSLILFELIDAEIIYDSTGGNSDMGLRTIGYLTVAGVTKRDTIDTTIKILPGRKFEITGQKNLSMLDFKIIPPAAFFGLIKANERIVVGFDLIAVPENNYDKGTYVLDGQYDP